MMRFFESSNGIDLGPGAAWCLIFRRLAWLIPFLPLLGAGDCRSRAQAHAAELAHVPVVAGIALAFLVSLGLLFAAVSGEDGLRDALADRQRASRSRSSFASTV